MDTPDPKDAPPSPRRDPTIRLQQDYVRRLRRIAAARTLAVTCPHCTAPPGRKCRTANGHEPDGGYHQWRLYAAMGHLEAVGR